MQSNNFHCSTLPNSSKIICIFFLVNIHSKIGLRKFLATSSPLTIVEKFCESNDQESTTKNQQLLVELPSNINISPAVIFRYLGEKFTNMPDDQNEDTPPNYLIRPKQITVSLSDTIDLNSSTHMKYPVEHSTDNSNSSAEVRFLAR